MSRDQRQWIIDLVGQGTYDRLANGLSGSEFQSLLLELTAARAAARSPADVLAQYLRDGFCRPAAVDPRAALAIDLEFFSAAADFAPLELSPVAPLGVCSTVAPTDQKRVLSALRGTEVLADPTNVLALECASRLRRDRSSAVHLCASQRVVRAQPVPKLPGYAPHFRIFTLASGAIETRDHAFTVDALVRHVEVMLDGTQRLRPLGYEIGEARVDVLATAERAAVADRVAERLGARATRKPLEHPYYSGGIRYQFWLPTSDGDVVPIADGGTFDWLHKLTSNRRAVYVASGIGTQLLPARFTTTGLP